MALDFETLLAQIRGGGLGPSRPGLGSLLEDIRARGMASVAAASGGPSAQGLLGVAPAVGLPPLPEASAPVAPSFTPRMGPSLVAPSFTPPPMGPSLVGPSPARGMPEVPVSELQAMLRSLTTSPRPPGLFRSLAAGPNPDAGSQPGLGIAPGGGVKDLSDGASGGAVPQVKPLPADFKGLGTSADILAAGRSQLGLPYIYNATSPGQGFDCSGFTSWVLSKNGIQTPSYSVSQFHDPQFPRVAREQLSPGDLIFFHYDTSDPRFMRAAGEPNHVGIYAGGGRMLDAGSGGVEFSPIDWGAFIGGGAVVSRNAPRQRAEPSPTRRRRRRPTAPVSHQRI